MRAYHRLSSSHASSDEQVRRFPEEERERLSACIALSERVAQLAHTHPLLLYALADAYGPLSARREVVRRAVAGRPLADVAAPLDLPACLRRLPPEACSSQLPYFRWSPAANRSLAPLVPRDAAAAKAWLRHITFAAHAGNEAFAIWVAKQRCLYETARVRPSALRPLALHSWHCLNRKGAADPLLTAPAWSPSLGLSTAIDRARAWLRRLKLLLEIGPTGIVDSWVPQGKACGFVFQPLLTPQDLIAEAHVMQNCVDSYGADIARNACRLFRVMRKGCSVATLELRHDLSERTLTVTQLKAPANRECPLALWHAAWSWLKPYVEHMKPPRPNRDRPGLARLLDRYASRFADANDGPDQLTIAGLNVDLNHLKRCARAQRSTTAVSDCAA